MSKLTKPMISIGTKVEIIDNFHEHIGYMKGTTQTILAYDDYGNYILSSGHCCSEAEIEILN
jgi:hypothetical protein